jgi:uncharacterized protein YPO0396
VRETISSEAPPAHPHSLVRKRGIQPASPFYAWIETELAQRFDYACCSNMDQFRREQRAVMRNGQVKAGGERDLATRVFPTASRSARSSATWSM